MKTPRFHFVGKLDGKFNYPRKVKMQTFWQQLCLKLVVLMAGAVLGNPAWAQFGGFSQQQAKLGAATSLGTAQQGSSVAVSPDGNTAVVGGEGDNASVGAAWVFTRSSDGVWTPLQKLLGNDSVGQSRQGTSVALSADGNTIIVGAKSDTPTQYGA